jgi:hypothetical protein
LLLAAQVEKTRKKRKQIGREVRWPQKKLRGELEMGRGREE